MADEPPYGPRSVCFLDQLSLPAAHTAVSASRHFLRFALSKWRTAPVEDDVLLIASELVTNAVTAANAVTVTGTPAGRPTRDGREGGDLVTVRLVGLRGRVVIEVWDESDELPVLRAADDESENGRGLFIVQRLATSWGSCRSAGGKVTWAELPVRATVPSPCPVGRPGGLPPGGGGAAEPDAGSDVGPDAEPW
ncbi:ATP-binding protein [Streptomyces sp. AM 4-1-1]|uniref:ATP-binding protein n=1 Tax=Streptomyces sp. AM 4-1-1 TaxID=3028710 RepID=UPI0023B98141|nr:ATP-binding protein [Streptomyces sp. AM 4-1-1]WEH34708.1 ATP-binding protein [Streptomyces sp. AM 4-1-1]